MCNNIKMGYMYKTKGEYIRPYFLELALFYCHRFLVWVGVELPLLEYPHLLQKINRSHADTAAPFKCSLMYVMLQFSRWECLGGNCGNVRWTNKKSICEHYLFLHSLAQRDNSNSCAVLKTLQLPILRTCY